MARLSREIEFLALLGLSVLPMYSGESSVQIARLVVFHILIVGLIAARVVTGRYLTLPSTGLNVAAIAYLAFFFIDISTANLIGASAHMLLFVALWQAVHGDTRHKHTQRVLVLCLLFVSSMATSTSMIVVPFAAVFFFLLFRQFMYLSHEQSLRSIGRQPAPATHGRAAITYLLPVTVASILIFPMMPRLKSSVLQGVTSELSQTSTTGISESIDFNEMRSISPDGTAVARIWMPRQVVAFFTPLRLKAEVYDAWVEGKWDRHSDDVEPVAGGPDQYRIARASGLAPEARIEQQVRRDGRLFLPDRTYVVYDVPRLLGSPTRGVYRAWGGEAAARAMEYRVKLGWETGPLEAVPPPELIEYPLTPGVLALAAEITTGAVTTKEKAEAISRYLLSNYEYLANPADLGRRMTVEEFLLDVRRGHCEYFAAGMVVLLRAVGIQSRIVGGFYGGRLNPLTGYWVIALSDAHAWVEVWDAGRWDVYDPTPPGLRPGTASEGILRAYAAAITDSVTYFWDRYVLSYGVQDQVELLLQGFRSFVQGVSNLRALMLSLRTDPTPLLLIALLILGALGLRRWRRGTDTTLGEQFAELASHAGVTPAPAATSRELLSRFRDLHPELGEAAASVVSAGERERFAQEGLPLAERRLARRTLGELRTRLGH